MDAAMDNLANEKLPRGNEYPRQAGEQRGEAIREQLRQDDRRKRSSKDSMKRTGLQWSWELEARLRHYLADRSREARRDVDRSEVVAEALEEFLSKRGH